MRDWNRVAQGHHYCNLGGAIGSAIGGGGIAGSDVSSSTTGSSTAATVGTERLVLEQAATDKIIQDVLGSTEGLSAIFSGEDSAGIFNSSVAAQASGDLASKLVGELAKLTGTTETTNLADSDTSSTQRDYSEGLAGQLGLRADFTTEGMYQNLDKFFTMGILKNSDDPDA